MDKNLIPGCYPSRDDDYTFFFCSVRFIFGNRHLDNAANCVLHTSL